VKSIHRKRAPVTSAEAGYIKLVQISLAAADSNQKAIRVIRSEESQEGRRTKRRAPLMHGVFFGLDIEIGMVIIAKTDTPPKAIRRFEGQVLIL